MKQRLAIGLIGVLGLSATGLVAAQRGGAPAPASRNPPRPALAQRIAHTDPSRYRSSPRVHGGAGTLDFFALFNADAIDANLQFLHRGVIQPKSGIGQHFHNYCEEMFVILDGEAQFTVDGRTSTLKGPAGAPARMGHAHAIYNATDKPVQWLNINVASFRGIYDNFDLGDDRVGAPLDRCRSSSACSSIGRDCSRSPASRAAPARCSIGARSARRSSSRPGPTSITCCCRRARRSGPARSRASAASTT